MWNGAFSLVKHRDDCGDITNHISVPKPDLDPEFDPVTRTATIPIFFNGDTEKAYDFEIKEDTWRRYKSRERNVGPGAAHRYLAEWVEREIKRLAADSV